MGKNYFEIIGTVKELTIFNTAQVVPSLFRKIDKVKEAVLLLEIDTKESNGSREQLGFHEGCEEEIELEVTNITPDLNPLS